MGSETDARRDVRILFITATRIGDAILSTGVLQFLIDRHPGARVTVACGPPCAQIFAAVPGLDRVIEMEKRRFAGHWFALWRQTVGCRWDIVVDLRRSGIAYFLAARRRKRGVKARQAEHRVIENARALGLAATPPPPTIWLAPEHERAAKRRMAVAAGRRIIALGPTANWRAKTWRAGNFAELIARLTAPDGLFPDAMIAVFGAMSERHQAEPVLASIPEARRLDFVGHLGLLSAAACLRHAHIFIGNDSGLMHMAAAMNVPVLGLFGPSREVLYAPWGRHCATVRTPESFAEIHPEGFDHRTADSLMDSLTVDAVENAVLDLMRDASCVSAEL